MKDAKRRFAIQNDAAERSKKVCLVTGRVVSMRLVILVLINHRASMEMF